MNMKKDPVLLSPWRISHSKKGKLHFFLLILQKPHFQSNHLIQFLFI